ncbi:MAG: D-2-hydroxyacid dehydrogenase [Rubrobacteraceae bacterium]
MTGEIQRPVVTVLGAGEDPQPPDFGAVVAAAEFRFADSSRELEEVLPGSEGILVWNFRSTLLQDAWHRADSLRWVHVAAAGVDTVLFRELVESDVILTNSRGVFDRPIAEYVLGLMLLFAKGFRGTFELQQRHEWWHRETETLFGKRLLVVGAGSIGRTIARLARCFGMKVDAIARAARDGDEDFGRVDTSERLDEALGTADYVVIAAPLTAQTNRMFGAEQFRRMKPEARLVNVGRGPIVDQPALEEALRGGEIAGAALDVFQEEPLPEDHPLWDAPQVYVSPHMSGDFVGWREALEELFAENFRRWQEGEELLNVVDKKKGYAG